MNTKNTETLARALPFIAPLALGAKSAQRGRTLKLYRPEAQLPTSLDAPIRALVELGVTVRVFDRGKVWVPAIVADTLVWQVAREGRKVRTNAKVEVVL